MSTLIGIDIGGTFTDVVVFDEATGSLRTAKVPSTPGDQSVGLANGLFSVADSFGASAVLVHSSTVSTNAIIECDGAHCALITTKGFRDIIEIGRRDRPSMYGFTGSYRPLIPRSDRYEVDERIVFDGSIHTSLNVEEVEAIGRELLRKGVQAVSICFLHSYKNPEHEQLAQKILQTFWPDPKMVSISSALFSEIGEFERFVTATTNSYLYPVMSNYLGRLNNRLKDRGFGGSILVMQSNGGVLTLEDASELAVNTVKSGPAAGVVAGCRVGAAAGYPNVITCDMGGTSFDVSLVVNSTPVQMNEVELGFRMPLLTSTIDVVAIGAGGGSIAYVDRAGVLNVGPRSARALPGPAAYGKGGKEPTVTDANVVLGRLDPRKPMGTKDQITLHPDLAIAAVEHHIARPLGMGVEQAADAMMAVVVSNMAQAIRNVSVARGHDPRDFALVSFGGAGPLHICALLREMNIPVGLVPPMPGLSCAIGCLVSNIRYDTSNSFSCILDDLKGARMAELEGLLDRQESMLRKRLSATGMTVLSHRLLREVDMQYEGQGHAIRLQLPDSLSSASVRAAFESAYALRFGRVFAAGRPVVVKLRSALEASHAEVDVGSLWKQKLRAPAERVESTDIQIFIDGRNVPARSHDRWSMPVGTVIPGPCLVNQEDATTFIEPGFEGVVDANGNIAVTLGKVNTGRSQ